MRKRTVMSKDIFNKNLMVVYMILFSLIMEIVGILIVNDKKAFTMGIAFGLIFSILKLMLMQNSIKKSVLMPEAKAQRYANVQYMIRYILTGVVLLVAALEPTIDIIGVFLGLLSMKVGAYIQILMIKKAEKTKA